VLERRRQSLGNLTVLTVVCSDARSPLPRASGCSGCGDIGFFLLVEMKPSRVHGTRPREEDDVHGDRDDGESATAETLFNSITNAMHPGQTQNLCCSRQVAHSVINRMDRGWASPAKSHRDGGLDDMFDGPHRDNF